MTTALACIALLGLLVFGLGFAISVKRGKTDTITGTSGDPADPLHKLVRAHGNTTEYAPMMAVLILALGSMSPRFLGSLLHGRGHRESLHDRRGTDPFELHGRSASTSLHRSPRDLLLWIRTGHRAAAQRLISET